MKYFFLTLLVSISIAALADESQQTLLGGTLDESPVEIHGFLSQGYLQTTHNNYLPTSKEGTFDFSDVGLNFNKVLAKNFRAGAQIYARNFGRTGDFKTRFDWFLLDYKIADSFGIRIGRIKIPHGLYNETNDSDSSRIPISLPQSVYPTELRDYVLAQNGAEVYGYVNLDAAGAIDFNVFRGTLNIEQPDTTGLGVEYATSDVPYVYGARIVWGTPVEGLKLAQTYQKFRYDANIFISSLGQTHATVTSIAMGVSSLEYTTEAFEVAIEYAKWWTDFESVPSTVFPTTHQTQERYYGMGTYHAREWLHPGVLYSEIYPNERAKETPQNFVKDGALFVRIDLTPNWLVKFEWHEIHGTSGLSSSMNDGKSRTAMDKKWQMFMAKTTVYF